MTRRRTKIVATLGPASCSPESLAALINEGVDVFRINSAHTPDAEFVRLVRRVRSAARRLGATVGILQDLPGPKLRLGKLPGEGQELRRGEMVSLFPGKSGGSARTLPVDYRFLARDLKPGHRIFIADGLVQLKVAASAREAVTCRVMQGGQITSGKGVNLPDSKLSLKAFTSRDRRHLRTGIRAGVDFVGVSFVGNGQDIRRARAAAKPTGRIPALIAKIERREALRNLAGIVAAADGVMVARGDLGVEISFAEIPGAQRRIVRSALEAGKPAIVATQVLESMLANPRPTRAEVTDIAHSVEEGADAVMLSGETSIGKHPIEAARALTQVILAAERVPPRERGEARVLVPSDYIVRDARDMAEGLRAKAIVVPSRTGRTVMRISRFRPAVPILALVRSEALARLFSLYWGVNPVRLSGKAGLDLTSQVRALLKRHKLASKGERALVISAGPGVPRGETGMVQIVEMPA